LFFVLERLLALPLPNESHVFEPPPVVHTALLPANDLFFLAKFKFIQLEFRCELAEIADFSVTLAALTADSSPEDPSEDSGENFSAADDACFSSEPDEACFSSATDEVCFSSATDEACFS
jgi:hypothetical protein